MADNGNASVVLNTTDYTQKSMAPVDDPAYKKLAKDHTQPVEWRTTLLIKEWRCS